MDTLEPDELNNNKTSIHPHGVPEAINTSRRRYLQGLLSTCLIGLTGSLPLTQLTANPSSNQSLNTFIALSQTLTERTHLDTTVSMRLLDALSQHIPDFVLQLPVLVHAITSGKLDTTQENLALAILEAWYLGTVNHQVVIYEEALMFSVSGGIWPIRSYCPNQPGFWAEQPQFQTNAKGTTP